MTKRLSLLHCVLTASCLLAGTAAAQEEKKPPAPAAYRWGDAELVFTAKLNSATPKGTGLSFPPVHMHELSVTVEKPLRGKLTTAETVVLRHTARQVEAPVFATGKVCLFAARWVQGNYVAELVADFDAKLLDQATLACALPIGWKLDDGKPVSPWAAQGDKAWNTTSAPAAQGMLVCAKTGRPVLLCGSGVALEVEHVPPKAEVKFGNPDGDGEYKITVRNVSDKPLVVPALLSDGKEILWAESLVILCQNKAYICPGGKGVSGKVEAKTLAPRETVSTVVNALRLNGPEWPKGGYRIEFRFCLGELSQTKSFYYLSRHHDVIRAAFK